MQRLLILLILSFTAPAWSLYTELGVSHSYKKTSFDEHNYIESQAITGSISLYFWENIALELSYTNGIAVRSEKLLTIYPVRTITQYSEVYGSDLILSFADRKSTFQPYIKGGAAYITKKQVTQDEGYPSTEITPPAGVAPSYGAGLKILMTEQFAIKMGIDVWSTPIDEDSKSDDMAARVGVSWMF